MAEALKIREADVSGAGTRIWRSRHVSDRGTGVAAWCAHAPWCHPIWTWYAISLIHLRDVPGFPPANFRLEGGTHELLITAIDPDQCPAPDPDRPPWPFLVPIDLEHQFIRESDAEALRSVEEALELVRQRRLSLDRDFRRAWRRLLGGESHG